MWFCRYSCQWSHSNDNSSLWLYHLVVNSEQEDDLLHRYKILYRSWYHLRLNWPPRLRFWTILSKQLSSKFMEKLAVKLLWFGCLTSQSPSLYSCKSYTPSIYRPPPLLDAILWPVSCNYLIHYIYSSHSLIICLDTLWDLNIDILVFCTVVSWTGRLWCSLELVTGTIYFFTVFPSN